MPRCAAVIPLVLALALAPADAEEANLSSQPEGAPGTASQLVLAQRLFRQASEGGDPVLLLAAIRLARGVALRPALGWERTTVDDGKPPTSDGPPDPSSPAVLAMLQGMAVDDPNLQDLVYDLDAQVPQGRLPIATVARSDLSGGAKEDWRLPLSGSVAVEIALIGDGGTALGLSVTDDTGATVCTRPPALDPALCRFTPASNGFFIVQVVNAGAGRNSYQLVGN
jgi:hypothetical protein